MNWARLSELTLPLSYWDTMCLRMAQRVLRNTWDEHRFRGGYWNEGLRAAYQDLGAIIEKHGSRQTLDEWVCQALGME